MTNRTICTARTRWSVLAVAGCAVLAVGACGGPEEDAPLEDAGVEVEGGAVGPDVRVTDDLGLQQVQLEYPLDGVYEEGEDARLFLGIANTGTEADTLVGVSGPDFAGARSEVPGAQPTAGGGVSIAVPAEDNVYVGAEGEPSLTLLDLGRPLRSSQSIPVTFVFEQAGEVTIDAMVAAEGQDPTPPFDFPDPAEDPTP